MFRFRRLIEQLNYLTSIALMLFRNSRCAQVLDMSADVFAQYAAQQASWEVTVTCDSQYQASRVIHQSVDGGRWCAKHFSNICHSQKQLAAEMVCGNPVTQIIRKAAIERQQTAAQKRQAELRKRRLAEQQAQVRRDQQQRLQEQKRQAEQQQALAAKKQREMQLRLRPIVDALSTQDNPERIKARIDLEQKLLEVEQQMLEIQRRLLAVNQRSQMIEQHLSLR